MTQIGRAEFGKLNSRSEMEIQFEDYRNNNQEYLVYLFIVYLFTNQTIHSITFVVLLIQTVEKTNSLLFIIQMKTNLTLKIYYSKGTRLHIIL